MGDRKLLNDESRITKKEKNFIKKILKIINYRF
ncbi:Uncharacterised protein [Clostridium cochlearium]|nr:Uncharacterised protein [Clostridium cochlearium]